MSFRPDPMSAAMWRELVDSETRTRPRLESRFGVCPVCIRPATFAYSVQSIVWSVCDACATRWPVGEDVLYPVHDQDALSLVFHELAQYEQLMPSGDSIVTTTALDATRALTLFDPWPAAQTLQQCLDVGAPAYWYHLSPDARLRIGGVAVRVVRNPEEGRPVLDILLRATYQTEQGFGRKVDAEYRRFYVEDPVERARWREAAEELRGRHRDTLLDEAVRNLRRIAAKTAHETGLRNVLNSGR